MVHSATVSTVAVPNSLDAAHELIAQLRAENAMLTTKLEAATAAEAPPVIRNRLFMSLISAFEVYSIFLGIELGLYIALKPEDDTKEKWMTSTDLANAAGINERYAREWLEAQTVSGFLLVDNAAAEATARHYRIPAEYVDALTNSASLTTLLPMIQLFVAAMNPIYEVVEAYRTGDGVPYERYGKAFVHAMGLANKPLFLNTLARDWLPAIKPLHAALQRPGARVADVGCGVGWSSIGIACAYPEACVDGFDIDECSVQRGRAILAEQPREIAARVTLRTDDVSTLSSAGEYDLAIACLCVHDMSNPVSVLAGMRRITKPGGHVLVAELHVNDTFTGAKGGPMERYAYGWSQMHCLPACMADKPSCGTGTVMRAPMLEKYAREAGFKGISPAPIEHPVFKVYSLEA